MAKLSATRRNSHARREASTGLLYLFLGAWLLTIVGCAYQLPTITPPSKELVRIAAKTREQYFLQVNREHERLRSATRWSNQNRCSTLGAPALSICSMRLEFGTMVTPQDLESRNQPPTASSCARFPCTHCVSSPRMGGVPCGESNGVGL